MIYRQKKTVYILITFITIILIFVVISAYIKVPLKISTYSEVFPKEKWILTRGNGGQIISNLIDFVQGHTAQYNISQFERGEFVSANFSDYFKGKKELTRGDTVVFIKSSNVRDQLVAAEGELEIALANLKSKNSSQKEALIREAESRLMYTIEKIDEQKILFVRTKQLFEKGYSSQQEYELQKWNLDLLEIEKKIYSAQVENLRTGVKPEEIKLLESQIRAAQSRLKFLKEWESQFILLSPINGKVISSFSQDTLLSVINNKQVVLHSPVKVLDLSEIGDSQKVPVYFSNIDKVYEGKILYIDKEVKLVNAQQVVFISLLLDNPADQLLPGMIVENSLELKKITLFDQIKRLISY